ncbi:MAG: hypothetical protein WA960_20190 [Tunicatimonas sp.]
MRYDAVENLVETRTEGDLLTAKEIVLRGQGVPSWVAGANEGDQLSNLCAALYALNQMKQGVRLDIALRQYSTQIREVPF